MEPSQSSAVISCFTEGFGDSAPLGVIVYEMFGLHDSFGQVMKANLQVTPGDYHYQSAFTEPSFLLSESTEYRTAWRRAISGQTSS